MLTIDACRASRFASARDVRTNTVWPAMYGRTVPTTRTRPPAITAVTGRRASFSTVTRTVVAGGAVGATVVAVGCTALMSCWAPAGVAPARPSSRQMSGVRRRKRPSLPRGGQPRNRA